MKDSASTTKVLEIISSNTNKPDSTKFFIDKGIVKQFIKEKQFDYNHLIDITAPIIAALLTLLFTRLFDNIAENKKNKREILKENRRSKIKLLRSLNSFFINIKKPTFPDADYDDFLDWIADRCIGVNPFEELNKNANIIFHDQEILRLVSDLYDNAEKISFDYDWGNMTHGSTSHKVAENILNDLPKIMDKISRDLNG